jgi:hypothetical protein
MSIQLSNQFFHFGAAVREVHWLRSSTAMADPIAQGVEITTAVVTPLALASRSLHRF